MTERLLPDSTYLDKIYEMMVRIERQEQQAMDAAAEAAYRSIKNGGLLHLFTAYFIFFRFHRQPRFFDYTSL